MYFDYRFRFPADGLTQAVAAFDALRAAGILPADSLPFNLLGDPIEQDGKVVAFGRSGRRNTPRPRLRCRRGTFTG